MSNVFHFVSPQVKAVLDQFDMGNNLIKPVVLYKSDQKTVAHEGYCVLNIATHKDTFLPELSPDAERTYSDKTDIWSPPPLDGSARSITMSAAALEGADIWMEKRVFLTKFFLSDRLVRALSAAGVVKLDRFLNNGTVSDIYWTLKRCSIADE